MKLKILLLYVVITLTCLNACTFTGFNKNNFVKEFKGKIEEDKCFLLEVSSNSEFVSSNEKFYYCKEFIYKLTESISEEISFISHRLYLKDGSSYYYDGETVSKTSPVDFSIVKKQVLITLFGDDIKWKKSNDKYVYIKNEYKGSIAKGDCENSLNFEITYSAKDVVINYVGKISLFETLDPPMPNVLKDYI